MPAHTAPCKRALEASAESPLSPGGWLPAPSATLRQTAAGLCMQHLIGTETTHGKWRTVPIHGAEAYLDGSCATNEGPLARRAAWAAAEAAPCIVSGELAKLNSLVVWRRSHSPKPRSRRSAPHPRQRRNSPPRLPSWPTTVRAPSPPSWRRLSTPSIPTAPVRGPRNWRHALPSPPTKAKGALGIIKQSQGAQARPHRATAREAHQGRQQLGGGRSQTGPHPPPDLSGHGNKRHAAHHEGREREREDSYR